MVSRRISPANSRLKPPCDPGFCSRTTNTASSGIAWPARRRTRINCGHLARCRARNDGDSGSHHQSSAASAIEISPPAANNTRQPNAGMTIAASSPASAPPSGMATIVNVTASGRLRAGTYSEASVAAFGMAPPRPRPARNRTAARASIEFTNASAAVNAPKMNTLPSRAGRRPHRSPRMPPSSPPSIMPNGPIARASVNSRRGRPHSWISVGTALGSS